MQAGRHVVLRLSSNGQSGVFCGCRQAKAKNIEKTDWPVSFGRKMKNVEEK